ncbi:hypothetical protein [Microbispora sp. NBRC 16548]|uniref:methylation-associated defense system restriction endonuclease subunit S MAD5 n=1 Tax=Microbispora sp. NBRC 16548 TaxID=3030994 RepID=UPI0024A5EA5C|nr:hypothetical protein [Microbispora sp. NBRC 16548]GLX05701.1 type I restriction-modification system restriction endonuclease DNA specificity subunit HsdS [Microbispora sp. NBRC 16548]
MKLVDIDNPVRASWFAEQGHRLDPSPYISETFAAKRFLERIARTDLLGDITEDIFHAGRAARSYTTSREHGIPFLGSADIFESDLSFAPLIAKGSAYDSPRAKLQPGWTLITCSGMNAGRVTYSRIEMSGYSCSQDVMRVVPNRSKIPAGYLYTFLASPFGIPLIRGGIYGTSVKHIEPSHIIDLPIPRVGPETERRIDVLIQEAMELRYRFQIKVADATRDLFESAGLPELLDICWHGQPRDLDFSVTRLTPTSLRALNYMPRARRILDEVRAVPHRTLGDICAGGRFSRGLRFKRIDSNSKHGIKLVGQRQGFWLKPSGRWISQAEDIADVTVPDETVLIAARGTLGESEVYCRATFVTHRWTRFAYTDDFIRIRSGMEEFPNAYLFAFLRSDAAFRMLRSTSSGSKQQDINEELRRQIPVPECNRADRERIAETVRSAYRLREEADLKEDQALALLDQAVREAAG